MPGTGYVGVGVVAEPAVRADAFKVKNREGALVPISEARLDLPGILADKEAGEAS